MTSKKISIDEVRNISPKILLRIINRAKKYLKNNEIIKNMCKEYNLDVNILDIVPIKFGDLDVSARTDHGVITLNYKLLCDGDFFKDYHYICHEFQHFLDQTMGDKPTMGADDGDYLSNPFEQEGFQRQIQYIDDEFGEDEAEKYVDHLLDHHDKDGKERDKLKDKLEEKI
jgi:hypothetical protein